MILYQSIALEMHYWKSFKLDIIRWSVRPQTTVKVRSPCQSIHVTLKTFKTTKLCKRMNSSIVHRHQQPRACPHHQRHVVGWAVVSLNIDNTLHRSVQHPTDLCVWPKISKKKLFKKSDKLEFHPPAVNINQEARNIELMNRTVSHISLSGNMCRKPMGQKEPIQDADY